MSDKPGHQANWFRRLQRSPWTLAIVAVGAVLTGLAAWTQAIDTLLLFTGIKPNALQLARDDERARFSRELTRAAWNRLFAMRRYVSTVEAGYPALNQDRTWERYASIFEEWNRDLMVPATTVRFESRPAHRDSPAIGSRCCKISTECTSRPPFLQLTGE